MARRVVIVAVPPVRTLDVFGPAEVFGDANRRRSQDGDEPPYAVTVVSGGQDSIVAGEVASSVHAECTYREWRGSIDTLLVAGGCGASETRYERGLLDWLRGESRSARRFGSICTGAFVLADAGLLDGRRATTHWGWCAQLAREYPRVSVDPDPIYIRDGNCYTSAGVTSGIDLALALVEDDLGSAVSLHVARMMVVFLRRPGGQAQFSATLAAQANETRPFGDLLAWLPDNLRRPLSVATLARHAAMSQRNFARLFRDEMGTTPARHIEDLRIEAARRQLESTSKSMAGVANATGFGTAERLRRAFVRRLGTTPGQYRASFTVAESVAESAVGRNRG